MNPPFRAYSQGREEKRPAEGSRRFRLIRQQRFRCDSGKRRPGPRPPSVRRRTAALRRSGGVTAERKNTAILPLRARSRQKRGRAGRIRLRASGRQARRTGQEAARLRAQRLCVETQREPAGLLRCLPCRTERCGRHKTERESGSAVSWRTSMALSPDRGVTEQAPPFLDSYSCAPFSAGNTQRSRISAPWSVRVMTRW